MSAADKGSALAALAADLGTGEAHTRAAPEDSDLFAALDAAADDVAGAFAPPKRGPGRPKGAPNRTTIQLQRWLMGRGYRDPAEMLAAIESADPRQLAADLGGFRVELVTFDMALEVAKLMIRAAEGLMPYFHNKRPLAIEHTGDGARPLILIHPGQGGYAARSGDGGMSIHNVEAFQALGATGAVLSHDGQSHGAAQAADVSRETED